MNSNYYVQHHPPPHHPLTPMSHPHRYPAQSTQAPSTHYHPPPPNPPPHNPYAQAMERYLSQQHQAAVSLNAMLCRPAWPQNYPPPNNPQHPNHFTHLGVPHGTHPYQTYARSPFIPRQPASPQLSPGGSPILSVRNLMSPRAVSPKPPNSKNPALPPTTILGGTAPKWSGMAPAICSARPKFVLGPRIGCGSFGCVYKGQWLGPDCTPDVSRGFVAIKVEPIATEKSTDKHTKKSPHPGLLPAETTVLLAMAGELGYPAIYWYGEFPTSTTLTHTVNESGVPAPTEWRTYRALVMQLLGPSLQDLFDKCGKRLSVKTVCLIADQLIQRLERLHIRGYLHRDLKPENVLLGADSDNKPVLYLIDFGLAQARHRAGDPPPKRAEKCIGTLRYMCRSSHRGKPQAPRDDLEALGYLLVFFAKGSLPWQRKNMGPKAPPQDPNEQKRAVLKSKDDHAPLILCSGLPPAFAEYMAAVRGYAYGDVPDYTRLRNYFVDCVHSLGERMDLQFDWDATVPNVVPPSRLPYMLPSPTPPPFHQPFHTYHDHTQFVPPPHLFLTHPPMLPTPCVASDLRFSRPPAHGAMMYPPI